MSLKEQTDSPLNFNEYEISLESHLKEIACVEKQLEKTHHFFYAVIAILIVCIAPQYFDYKVHDIMIKAFAAIGIYGLMYMYWHKVRKKELLTLERRKQQPTHYGARLKTLDEEGPYGSRLL